MFRNFFGYFNITDYPKIDPQDTEGCNKFLRKCGGMSFGNGLYRLHKKEELEKWNQIILEGFPEFKGRIDCFGYDWLGRQFATDSGRIVNNEPQILMFEPGTGEALEIPCSFTEFHDEEIPMYHDACLASDFFKEWVFENPSGLKPSECAGYKIPLFLGGADHIENLEKSDLEVYWSICVQLILKS